MAMDMERLSLIVIHPMVGSTASAEGLVNIKRDFIEERTKISARSVEGLRVTQKFKDPNCTLTATVLTGSDMDAALSRALLYPKTKGSVTWLDQRVDGILRGGSGQAESIEQMSYDPTAETQDYVINVSKYVGS
ncbi:MAG: hypothetical protein ACRC5T_06195 [Cetobacterium sp.]